MYYLLMTTSSCVKCPSFKEEVKKHIDFDGEILDEKSPSFSQLSEQFGICSAPTILIFESKKDLEDLEIPLFQTSEAYEMIDYLKNIKK